MRFSHAGTRLGQPSASSCRRSLFSPPDATWQARVHDALIPRSRVTAVLPIDVGDFVDFYSSIEHASNVGKLFRPDGEPLLPNYRHLPVGYHGRAGSVVVGGTPIRRPHGQTFRPGRPAPIFGPTRELDIELELGFVTGSGAGIGQPVAIGTAREHVYGFIAPQRLERPRHSSVGIPAARTISRKIICDIDFTLDRIARRAGTGARPKPAAGSRTAAISALPGTLRVRHRPRDSAAKPAHERAKRVGDVYFARQFPRHVLEFCSTTGACDRERCAAAPRRSLRIGNDLRNGSAIVWEFARTDVARRTADPSSYRGTPYVPRRRATPSSFEVARAPGSEKLRSESCPQPWRPERLSRPNS